MKRLRYQFSFASILKERFINLYLCVGYMGFRCLKILKIINSQNLILKVRGMWVNETHAIIKQNHPNREDKFMRIYDGLVMATYSIWLPF